MTSVARGTTPARLPGGRRARLPVPGSPLVLGAALVTVVLWASAFVGIRTASHQLSAGPLSLGRLLVGAVFLGTVALLRREPLVPRRDLGRLLIYGVSWFGLYNLALNFSEQRIDAGTAAMIVSVGPLLIAALAGVLLREGFPRSLLVGSVIAVVGTVLIGVAISGQGPTSAIGIAVAFLTPLTYAVGVIAQKPLLARSSALAVTTAGCVAGAVVCLPFAPQLVSEVGHASAATLAWVVYLGVLPTGVAFTTWAYALRHTTAGRLATMSYLVAPLTVLFGWLLLGEVPPWLALIGGALCLVGVGYSRLRR